LDAIGQSSVFLPWSAVTRDADRQSQAQDLAADAGRYLTWLRTAFELAFEDAPLEKNPLAPYDRDLKQIHKLVREPRVVLQSFADLTIPFSPLPDSEHDLHAISAIYRMLHAAATVFLLSIANGRPLRGGVEVDGAVEHRPGEIYGRALDEALSLTGRHADCPRIIVGAQLFGVLHRASTSHDSSVYGQNARTLADICLQFVTRDDDGRMIVDYLNPAFRAHSSAASADSLANGQQTIQAQLSYWTAANNAPLIERWQRVLRYWRKAGL
jgi:hypothetical protein